MRYITEQSAQVHYNPVLGAAADYNAVAATNANTLTFSALTAGNAHVIDGIGWSLDTDPAAVMNIQVTIAAVVVRKFYITSKGPGFIPMTIYGNNITITLSSDANAATTLWVEGHREQKLT